MPSFPVTWWVKKNVSGACNNVDEAQLITLKDPITNNTDAEFQTNSTGVANVMVVAKQYVAYTNGGCPQNVSVNAPKTITLCNTCAL